MKLLLIGPLPPPITGNSLANKVIVENLDKYYPNVSVKCINTSYPTFKEDIGKFSLKKVLIYTKQYKEIYKILKSDKVYITIGQTFWGVVKYFPYIIFSKMIGKELVVHVHGNYLWQEYERLQGFRKKIFHKIICMFDKGIVLSESLRKNLELFLPKNKVFELHNFVEDYLFDFDIEKKIENNFSDLKIIYLSNLMVEKGILDLLEALILLKNKNISFKAKIAGNIDNSLKKKIFSYLNKLGNNVEYLGIVSGNKKKEMLTWGNVFVFPTYYHIEGQPISILEAMATGNIILTTNHGGIPDIFKEYENGFYVQKKNPTDIASKLEKLSKNLKYYSSIALYNYKLAKDKYRIEEFIKEFIKILEV